MNNKNNNINKTPVVFYSNAEEYKYAIYESNKGKSGIYC
jgi:hypothetical protein